jgi:hypothetical protein
VLVAKGEVEVTQHGFRELSADDILIDDVLGGIDDAVVVEDYPQANRGPSVLVLQRDGDDNPIHIVWGIPRGAQSPAVLITAYRPDPVRWSSDFTRRRSQ